MLSKLIQSELKSKVLALDTDMGVSREAFQEVTSCIRGFMGANAADILIDAMDVNDNTFYFPNEGDALKTWKRMLHAYKEEILVMQAKS